MVNIEKVHGSQNSFFLLDQTLLQTPLTVPELQCLAVSLTDAHKGLLGGSDGLLVVQPSTCEGALARMLIFNRDGSQALMCGNGLRTVARYLAEKYHQNAFRVQTAEASLQVKKYPELAPGVPAFSVEIGPVSFAKEDLLFQNLHTEKIINRRLPELSSELTFTAIAVPNPHLISFVPDIKKAHAELGRLGKKLNQANPYFPDGVNVSFAQILGPNKLFVETYERGVGFTNACGTGMSATSLAFYLNYPDQVDVDKLITVYNPGGLVQTKIHPQKKGYWLELIGNATVTHQIQIPEEQLHEAEFDRKEITVTETGEQEDYLRFVTTKKSH
ncbi:diaminopimelate epimerase [Lactobacillus sp. ESL0791]|uniref:diaminopimelate epimerase n=1 Tax=Lactobacillus sp. ESL0791 TaxID=2983234 RepID=UPI0023F81572|nr:diaminopimelate epimerase [Lactobacillus sp. ESL0791]MDF7638067.1 diaminopimelate epimerase [Lactobacillus sp. ESL0791]